MKLTKQNLKDIRKFARENIGGFGMWIELAEKISYAGKTDATAIYSYNMLAHDPKTRDLFDLMHWPDVGRTDIEPVNGFVWLDFHVHDHEELKNYVHVLLNDKNEILAMWKTWANEDELNKLITQ